jgi:hypothetical protein
LVDAQDHVALLESSDSAGVFGLRQTLAEGAHEGIVAWSEGGTSAPSPSPTRLAKKHHHEQVILPIPKR